MTYEVQQTRWDRLIRRVSGSIGPGSRVSETISELFPVLDVERPPSELLALMGTRTAWGRILVPVPDVGDVGRGQLFNPVGSGKLITVTQFSIISGPTDIFEVGLLEVALANLSAVGGPRDGRFGTILGIVGALRQDSNITASPALFRVALPAFSLPTFDVNDICVLPPGFGLVISHTRIDTAFTVSFLWREREAQASELSF